MQKKALRFKLFFIGIFGLFIYSLSAGWTIAADPDSRKLIHDFTSGADAFFRDGEGIASKDASRLAQFGSELFLQNFMRAYHITKNTAWLDKTINGIDVILKNTSKSGSFMIWRTKMGCVGRAWITGSKDNKGEATMLPTYQGVRMTLGGFLITGDSYMIEFTSKERFNIHNQTKKKVHKPNELFYENRNFVSIPGLTFRFKGQPVAGDKFYVTTNQAEMLDQIFEDAVIALPMAQFVDIVYKDNNLRQNPEYMDNADRYLKFIESNIINKWEKNWKEIDNNSGTYQFDKNPSLRFPLDYLPHHQALAMGRLFIVLQGIPGVAKKNKYRKRAEMIANYFKSKLIKQGNAYYWNYIDRKNAPKDAAKWPEDTATSHHVIGFVVEAYLNDIVFTKEDLKTFANTMLDMMWNRDNKTPGFGKTINSNEVNPNTEPIPEWITLGIVSDDLWKMLINYFQKTMYDEASNRCLKWHVAPHIAYGMYLRQTNKKK